MPAAEDGQEGRTNRTLKQTQVRHETSGRFGGQIGLILCQFY